MRFRLIILFGVFLLGLTSLNAAQTQCYKKNWNDPTTIESIALDGGVCASQYSAKFMIDNGWRVVDIKVESSNEGFDYTYYFTDDSKENVSSNEKIDDMKLEPIFLKIYDVTPNSARIGTPNLKIGQSGVIEHKYPDGKTIIVANAFVVQSNDTYSIIEFEKFDDLRQDAIPTTRRVAQVGDTFILNHLYNASVLIAPDAQSFNLVSERFDNFKFLHSDIFATYLKLEKKPLPSKNIFIEFAKSQNIGTIFFIVNKKVHIVDAKTFNILYSYDAFYQVNDSQLPFYTRVSEIEGAFWDIDFKKYIGFFRTLIGEKKQSEEEFLLQGTTSNQEGIKIAKELSYDAYYENLLGLANDR